MVPFLLGRAVAVLHGRGVGVLAVRITAYGRGLSAQHRIGRNHVLEWSYTFRIDFIDVFWMNFISIDKHRAIGRLSGVEIVE